MANPFLSIITINFNNANGLLRTIQSVKNQTYEDYEFVVIDGNSTDGSSEVIKAKKELLSKVVVEPDRGIYDAMNKGIELSTGSFLLFLNSGDCLNGAEALADFIKAPEFEGDIIYGDYKFDKGGKQFPNSLYDAYFVKTSLPHQSTLFKAEVFDQMGGYDLQFPMSADRAFYIKCYLSKKFRFKHIPQYLTLFDLSGISNDPDQRGSKLAEDERMLRHCYGDKYDEMKDQIAWELEQRRIPKYSVRGIVKRIKKRIKNLWN